MAIVEKIKEDLKQKLQRNLDRNYITRVLNIIGLKPILSAYGSTFTSKSDKFLNIVSIKSLKKAYSSQAPVAFGSLFFPHEFFHALEVTPFLPEVMAGFTAGLGLADQTLKEASSRWYTPDLCTFHRSASGAVEMDLFPIPKFIAVANVACDAAQKTFYIDAKKYGIEKNYYLFDVPFEKNEYSISYLAKQFEETAEDICKKLNKKIDLDKFEEVINLSNEFRHWAIKVNEIRKKLLLYPKNFNGLNFILPFHALAGTKDAVDLYKNMYFELKEYLTKQNNLKYNSIDKNNRNNKNNRYDKYNKNNDKDSNNNLGLSSYNINNNFNNNNNFNENDDYNNYDNLNDITVNNETNSDLENINPKNIKKLLWLHLKPYYKNNIFSFLEQNNFRVVFEEINYVYWPELNPKRPFESLAKKLISHPLNGSIDNRINAILNMVNEYNVDGTILFAHWGCRHSNGGARIIKDTLQQRNIPTLILDGDCLNKNNSSEGQILTRIQGFMEILEKKK